MLPKPLEELIESLKILPGVGGKTAFRMAMSLLCDEGNGSKRLAESIIKAKDTIKKCKVCNSLSEGDVCVICSNLERDRSTICVVEKFYDMCAIEVSGKYNGLYHVLGGVINPMEGISVKDLSFDLLLERVKDDEVKEIIIGLSHVGDNDTTIYYLQRILSDCDLRISKFAQGLSAGLEIIHADKWTLGLAMEDRKVVKV